VRRPAERHVSPVRLVTGIVLAAWGALFWFLQLTGRDGLYLSSRTRWVIPLGAALFTLAALGRLASVRSVHQETLTSRESLVLGAIALPVVLLLTLPPVTLDSYAVDRRSTFGGTGLQASARDVSGELDFIDVGAAQTFDAALEALHDRAGETIVLEGFVAEGGDLAADELLLARYIVTCCVADATIARVRVIGVPPGAYGVDDWVQVEGQIYPVGREVLVTASTIEAIPVPDRPYLTP
jgi:uncharacterized repeat protein (TIGR03943 family)